ncbi:MAG TPA: kelch repeat-containing protein, partial [Acidobacteriota bacterium]|nr:kelch repeat-containing protein [Acidobacteriota bacterium]
MSNSTAPLPRFPVETKRKFLFLSLIVFLVLPVWATTLSAVPAAASHWVNATNAPFLFTRFDAEFSTTNNKIYFLGGRLADGNTDGTVWEYDPVTGVYTNTGVLMPVPVS